MSGYSPITAFGCRSSVSNARRYSLACPAVPSCGLALSEAERSLPGILDRLEAALHELGLDGETMGVRMTGCPNGCVRPYQSDVGIVGRSGEKYTLFVGGHVHGHRLNFLLRDLVHRDDIVPLLRPVLALFKEERTPGETFGDWCQRVGVEALAGAVAGYRTRLAASFCERWASQRSQKLAAKRHSEGVKCTTPAAGC